MIEVRQLSYAYPSSSLKIFFPDFKVKAGESCLLLGESGSGKTTLLHLLGGLLRIQQGSIDIVNTSIASLSEHTLDKFRGQHIGFVFQKNHLISALTVSENLQLASFLADVQQSNDRIREVLDLLGLGDKAKSRVQQLSHGQAQRVAIARAIINKPTLILADEPTSALDNKNCDRVLRLLLDAAQKSNSTLLIATHDQRLKSEIQQQVNL